MIEIDQITETIEALNDSLDDNEEVYSKESKDIEFHPPYFVLLYPLGNHKIEKVIFTKLQLGTSIKYL